MWIGASWFAGRFHAGLRVGVAHGVDEEFDEVVGEPEARGVEAGPAEVGGEFGVPDGFVVLDEFGLYAMCRGVVLHGAFGAVVDEGAGGLEVVDSAEGLEREALGALVGPGEAAADEFVAGLGGGVERGGFDELAVGGGEGVHGGMISWSSSCDDGHSRAQVI